MVLCVMYCAHYSKMNKVWALPYSQSVGSSKSLHEIYQTQNTSNKTRDQVIFFFVYPQCFPYSRSLVKINTDTYKVAIEAFLPHKKKKQFYQETSKKG